MAKFTKVKKRTQPSVHSRAARRALSPTVQTPHALRNLPSQPNPKPKFSSNAGISKRKKKVQLTRAQKVRAQKAVERADAVAAQMDVKIKRSEGHAKLIKERSKEWLDVNVHGPKRRFDVLGDMADEEHQKNEADEILLELPKRFGDGDVPLDHEEALVLPVRTTNLNPLALQSESQSVPVAAEPLPETIPLPEDDIPDI